MLNKNMTPKGQKTFFKKTSVKILSIVFFIFIISFFILPSYLLSHYLNQDLASDSGFSKISCFKSKISPLWGEITISQLELSPYLKTDDPLLIEELKIEGFSRLSLIKLLLGPSEPIYSNLFYQAKLSVKELSAGKGISNLSHLKLHSLNLENFSLDPNFYQNFSILNNLMVQSLKISDFSIRTLDQKFLSLSGFSAYGLNKSLLSGLILSQLIFNDGNSSENPMILELGNMALSSLDLIPISNLFENFDTYSLLSLLSSQTSLDLAALTLYYDSKEALFLKEALFDSFESEKDKIYYRKINGLFINLNLLPINKPHNPLALSLFESMGPKIKANILLNVETTKDNKELPQFNFSLDLLETAFLNGSVKINYPQLPTKNTPPLFLLATLKLGDGRIEFINQKFVKNLYQNLSSHLFEGDNSQNKLTELLTQTLLTLENDPLNRIANLPVLFSEAELFIQNPQSLVFNWHPVDGFPDSTLKKGSALGSFGGLARSYIDQGAENFAESIKYDIIQDLNFSLEINGRAPVSVVVGEKPGPV